MIVLEDNDVLHLTAGGYGIYNTSQQDVEEAVPRVLLTLQVRCLRMARLGLHYIFPYCCLNPLYVEAAGLFTFSC